MIKFVKGKKSNYIYNATYGYNIPSVTKIVFAYIKSGELEYVDKPTSIIFRLLQRLGLK